MLRSTVFIILSCVQCTIDSAYSAYVYMYNTRMQLTLHKICKLASCTVCKNMYCAVRIHVALQYFKCTSTYRCVSDMTLSLHTLCIQLHITFE